MMGLDDQESLNALDQAGGFEAGFGASEQPARPPADASPAAGTKAHGDDVANWDHVWLDAIIAIVAGHRAKVCRAALTL
jgi:hypothetical protein